MVVLLEKRAGGLAEDGIAIFVGGEVGLLKSGTREAQMFGNAVGIRGVDDGWNTLTTARALEAIHTLKDFIVGFSGQSVEVFASVLAKLLEPFSVLLEGTGAAVLPSLVPVWERGHDEGKIDGE